MIKKVHWSKRAANDYARISKYLEENWTKKEVISFSDKIELDLKMLLSRPEIGRSIKKDVRRLVTSKHNSIYYKIANDGIYLITIFDNRQNPKKLKI